MFYTKVGWNNKSGQFKPTVFWSMGHRYDFLKYLQVAVTWIQSKIQAAILGEIHMNLQ